MLVVGERVVRVTQVAITGVHSPLRAGVVQIVHRPSHRRSPGEIALMCGSRKTQAVHREVGLGQPGTIVALVVPIFPESAQSRGVHGRMGTVAMHEQGRADPHAVLVPLKSWQLTGEPVEAFGEEYGAIVV